MKGESALPEVATRSTPNNKNTVIIGKSHHAFFSRNSATTSKIVEYFAITQPQITS
jgi:hypothetical protein